MKLTGQGFRPSKPNIKEGSTVQAVWEKENPFDKEAIAIHCEGSRIGFVGKHESFYKTCDRSTLPLDVTVESVSFADKEGFQSFKEGELVSMIMKEPTPPLPFLFEPAKELRDKDGNYLKGKTKYQSITTFFSDNFRGIAIYALMSATGLAYNELGEYLDKYDKRSDFVCKRGTLAHDYIDCYLQFVDQPEKMLEKMEIMKSGYRSAYDDFLCGNILSSIEKKHLQHCISGFSKKYKVKLIKSEFVVWDAKLKLAGRLDALIEVEHKGEKKTILVDWKSGDYKEKEGMQGCFYAKNCKEKVDEVWIVSMNFKALEKGKAPKQGYSIKRITDVDAGYKKVVAMKKFKDLELPTERI